MENIEEVHNVSARVADDDIIEDINEDMPGPSGVSVCPPRLVDHRPLSKMILSLGNLVRRPDEFSDIFVPFIVSNLDVKHLRYTDLKHNGTENGKYTMEALRTMFNFIVFEDCIWKEVNNDTFIKDDEDFNGHEKLEGMCLPDDVDEAPQDQEEAFS
uniref:FBD domain-containing protein n=1 Tax=Parastrongyloides trichosuri TaxID=131310 RepID=A0A0N5A0X1_PARTI